MVSHLFPSKILTMAHHHAPEIVSRLDLTVLDCRIREQITVLHAYPACKTLCALKEDILKNVHEKRTPRPYMDLTSERIEFRTSQAGPALDEYVTLKDVFGKNVTTAKIYVKDLGPQVPYCTHLLAQYSTALALYFIFYARIPPLFSWEELVTPRGLACQAAALAWTCHFGRKIYETNLTEYFSKPTISAKTFFAQVTAVALATIFVALENNDPSYRGPKSSTLAVTLGMFFVCELGSHRIHLYLLKLRAKSPRGLELPVPTMDPFTQLYSLVSCPKLTYDLGSMFSYYLLTRNFYCLLGIVFVLYRFAHHAALKHNLYKSTYPDVYPKDRKAFLPFVF